MSEPAADLEHLAELARLRLDDEERTRLADQLERILAHVRQLQSVDVDGVPPTRHALERDDVVREDRAQPSLPREQVLEQAPDTEDGHFRVPGMLPT